VADGDPFWRTRTPYEPMTLSVFVLMTEMVCDPWLHTYALEPWATPRCRSAPR